MVTGNDERENFADICLELSELYDRNNEDGSISWFILNKDYENPTLILRHSLGGDR